MAPTIHLVRHAQGVHNLRVENETMHDPDLTPLGEEQCAALRAAFAHHARVAHLVASPLRRTLATCIRAFAGAQRGPVVALDLLQEISDAPCDVGSSLDRLRDEFGAAVDLARVHDGWTDKGPGSVFEPAVDKLTARAKEARKALRDIAGPAGGDHHVVVVSHGGFLHFLTDDWHDIPSDASTGWSNCEYRSYQFADPTGQDEEAALVETEESRRRRQFTEKPLSPLELRELRAAAQEQLVPTFRYTVQG